MKAIDSIRKWYRNTPKSTILFWVGCFIALLGAVIQFQLLPFILVVVGLLVAVWQKFRGDHEQDQKFEQERKVREAKEQYLYDLTPEGRTRRNISQLRAEMHMDSQDLHN